MAKSKQINKWDRAGSLSPVRSLYGGNFKNDDDGDCDSHPPMSKTFAYGPGASSPLLFALVRHLWPNLGENSIILAAQTSSQSSCS